MCPAPGAELDEAWSTPLAHVPLISQHFQFTRADTGHIEKIVKSFKPAVVGAEFSYSRGQGRPDPCDLLQFVDLCPIEVDAAGK